MSLKDTENLSSLHRCLLAQNLESFRRNLKSETDPASLEGVETLKAGPPGRQVAGIVGKGLTYEACPGRPPGENPTPARILGACAAALAGWVRDPDQVISIRRRFPEPRPAGAPAVG